MALHAIGAACVLTRRRRRAPLVPKEQERVNVAEVRTIACRVGWDVGCHHGCSSTLWPGSAAGVVEDSVRCCGRLVRGVFTIDVIAEPIVRAELQPAVRDRADVEHRGQEPCGEKSVHPTQRPL